MSNIKQQKCKKCKHFDRDYGLTTVMFKTGWCFKHSMTVIANKKLRNCTKFEPNWKEE